MIVTSQNLVNINANNDNTYENKKPFGGKIKIVRQQLDQLDLGKHCREYPIKKFLDAPENNREIVLISIKFPNRRLDEMAQEIKLESNLSFSDTNVFVKGEFCLDHRNNFTCFDADERQEIMTEIFEKEIDFKAYMDSGNIEEHMSLHKRNTVKELQIVMRKYNNKLYWAFLFGGW